MLSFTIAIVFATICIILQMSIVKSFTLIKTRRRFTHQHNVLMSMNKMKVFDSVELLGNGLCDEIVSMAKLAIKEKDLFTIAVPGGSVLKLLSGLKVYKDALDWSKVRLAYVNHKCVASDDNTATHHKAKGLFVDSLNINNCVLSIPDSILKEEVLGHDTVAHNYQKQLEDIFKITASNDVPIFDYMLLGMGKDGHIGSLYPNRKEVLENSNKKWVLSVDKKSPPSITLSLPVMNSAKEIRVVLMGEDKSEAALKGIQKTLTSTEFPVCGIKTDKSVVWFIDKPCANLLEAKGINTLEYVVKS